MDEIEFVIYSSTGSVRVKFIGRTREGKNMYESITEPGEHYIQEEDGSFYHLDYKFRPEKGKIDVEVAASQSLDTVFSKLLI